MAHKEPKQCHSACLDVHRMKIGGETMEVCKKTDDCEELGCKCHVFSYDTQNPNSPWERGNGPADPDKWIDPIAGILPNGGWGVKRVPNRKYHCYCVQEG
jgi:hypothetical protein